MPKAAVAFVSATIERHGRRGAHGTTRALRLDLRHQGPSVGIAEPPRCLRGVQYALPTLPDSPDREHGCMAYAATGHTIGTASPSIKAGS